MSWNYEAVGSPEALLKDLEGNEYIAGPVKAAIEHALLNAKDGGLAVTVKTYGHIGPDKHPSIRIELSSTRLVQEPKAEPGSGG